MVFTRAIPGKVCNDGFPSGIAKKQVRAVQRFYQTLNCSSRVALASIVVLCTARLAMAGDVQGPYHLSPGDTVEVGIVSLPDWPRRAVVQMDGTITLPQIGMIAVAGLTSAELQSRM